RNPGKRGLKNHPKREHMLGPTPCYLVKIDTLNVSCAYFGAVFCGETAKNAPNFQKIFVLN
ncbi:MAG: hypothetical protein LBK02_04580, partial [Treponema sp.]|nr:hypothetical protein [Treponema sp.]